MLFVLLEVRLLLWVFFLLFFLKFCEVWFDLNVEKLLCWVLEIIELVGNK